MPNATAGTVIVENERTRALLAELGEMTTSVTVDELLSAVERPLPPPEERLATFRQLLPESAQKDAEALLAAVDQLREARVLTASDASFVFGELPRTPKNLVLREAFFRYLQSPLADDRAAARTALVEKLRDGEVSFHGVSPVTFVRDRECPSESFSELAAHFGSARGVDECRLVEPWQVFGQSAAPRRGLWISGEKTALLRRLGDSAARALDRGIAPERLVLSLAASPEAADFLRHYLTRCKVPFRESVPSAKPRREPADWERLVQAVRRDPSRSLAERVGLASLLVRQSRSRRSAETLEAWLARLEAAELLGGARAADLLALPTAEAEPTPGNAPAAAAVRWLPFLPPPGPGVHWLGFADESLFDSPPSESWLSEGELALLAGHGFTVPGATSRRARAEALLHEALGPQAERRARCFSALPRSGAGRAVTLLPRAVATAKSQAPLVPVPAEAPGVLSSTALEAYAKCPARFYYAHRLRLRPADGDEDRQALLYGQAVHLALENVFKLGRPSTDGELVTALESAFVDALTHLSPGLSTEHAGHALLREAFAPMARAVPSVEKQLDRIFGPRTAFAFEKAFAVDIAGSRIRGKIDRIDRCADGQLVVIDYKTGTVDFSPDHAARGQNFQALVYALAVESELGEPCAAILFYDLKKGEAKRGLVKEEAVRKDGKKELTRGHALTPERWDSIRSGGLETLKRIAEGISVGDFTPSPSAAACDGCDYGTVCRVRYGCG